MDKIRTISGVVEELKKLDPDCAITEGFIRNLCKNDQIKYHKSGKKYLINIKDVFKYFE